MALRADRVPDASCRCGRAHGRRARRFPLDTIGRASRKKGCQRSHQCPLYMCNKAQKKTRLSEPSSVKFSNACAARPLTAAKAHSCDSVGQDHRNTNSEVLPSSQIVTCPDRAIFLRSDPPRAGEHKRTSSRALALYQAPGGIVLEEQPVDIVQISVLPAAVMLHVLGRRHFGSVEDRGLYGRTE